MTMKLCSSAQMAGWTNMQFIARNPPLTNDKCGKACGAIRNKHNPAEAQWPISAQRKNGGEGVAAAFSAENSSYLSASS
jgi:hypothetical protein